MKTVEFIRFQKQTPAELPPVACVDLVYDPDGGALVVRNSDGSTDTIGGGSVASTPNTVVKRDIGGAIEVAEILLSGGGNLQNGLLTLKNGENYGAFTCGTLTTDRGYDSPDADGTIPVVPPYADLSAANAALTAGDFWWDTTLKKLRTATA